MGNSMDNKTNEIVLFETSDRVIKLSVPVIDETVWLNRNQIVDLFGRDVKIIGKHIGNALKEELDDSTVAKITTVKTAGNREVEREINKDGNLLKRMRNNIFRLILMNAENISRQSLKSMMLQSRCGCAKFCVNR